MTDHPSDTTDDARPRVASTTGSRDHHAPATTRSGPSAPTSRTRWPASTRPSPTASTHEALAAYCLMLGDDALVYSHRLSEWCSRAPDLEEDIALANVALDLLGQARLLLARAAAADAGVVPALPEGSPVPPEDALAFFRDEPALPQRAARRARQRRLRGDDRAAAAVLDLPARAAAAAGGQPRRRCSRRSRPRASRRSPTTATTPAAGSSRWPRAPRSRGAGWWPR